MRGKIRQRANLQLKIRITTLLATERFSDFLVLDCFWAKRLRNSNLQTKRKRHGEGGVGKGGGGERPTDTVHKN